MKNKIKIPVPMTLVERRYKVNQIRMQILSLDVNLNLPQEYHDKLVDYIDNGTEFVAEYEITEFNRILIVNLFNDKNKKSQYILRNKK